MRSAGLWIPPENLDFGEVWEQKALPWVLPLENRSGEDITVEDLITSCGCAAVKIEPRPLTIARGQTGEVRLTLDLTPKDEESRQKRLRDVNISFAVRLDRPLPMMVNLRGKVRRALVLTPSAIQYGDILSRGAPFVAREVTIDELVPLSEIRARCDSAFGSVTVGQPRQENGARRRTLTFTPSQKLPEGPFSTAVELVGVAPNGGLLPPVLLPVAGKVMPEIMAIPECLDFGVHRPGEIVEGTVVLQSAAQRPFEVTDVAVASERPNAGCLVVKPRPSARSAVHRIDFTLRLDAVGRQSGQIQFLVRNADGETRKTTVLVSAYGIGAPREADVPSRWPLRKGHP